jgi:hypothetical protein
MTLHCAAQAVWLPKLPVESKKTVFALAKPPRLHIGPVTAGGGGSAVEVGVAGAGVEVIRVEVGGRVVGGLVDTDVETEVGPAVTGGLVGPVFTPVFEAVAVTRVDDRVEVLSVVGKPLGQSLS